MLTILSVLLALSLALNGYFFFTRKKPQKQTSLDAKQLVHDLTRNGRAVVKIEVVDPEGLFFVRASR